MQFGLNVINFWELGRPSMVQEYEEAGATWWCDGINGYRAPVPELLARIDAGPPS